MCWIITSIALMSRLRYIAHMHYVLQSRSAWYCTGGHLLDLSHVLSGRFCQKPSTQGKDAFVLLTPVLRSTHETSSRNFSFLSNELLYDSFSISIRPCSRYVSCCSLVLRTMFWNGRGDTNFSCHRWHPSHCCAVTKEVDRWLFPVPCDHS